MGRLSCNPWASDRVSDSFKPDGWGAMLIGPCHRVFEWIPICVVASLAIDATHEPTLQDALESRVIPGARTLAVPRPSHLKRLRANLLGTLDIDPTAAEALRPIPNGNMQYPCTPENAAIFDWPFYVLGRVSPQVEWTVVADLLRRT
jgi:hypothetical protein